MRSLGQHCCCLGLAYATLALLAPNVGAIASNYSDVAALLEEGYLALGNDQDEDKEKMQKYIAKQKEECHRMSACYCLKPAENPANGFCGWCQSTQRALLGTLDNPFPEEGKCAWWIFKHEDCPILWCNGNHFTSHLLTCGLQFLFFFLLAVITRFCFPYRPSRTIKPLLLQMTRSEDEFRRGLWGERLPYPSRYVQHHFDAPLGVCGIICTVIKSAWAGTRSSFYSAWVSTCSFAVYAFIFNVSLRLLPSLISWHQWKVFVLWLTGLQQVVDVLNTIVGLIFGFYALGRVDWWWKVIGIIRDFQHGAHDTLLMIGATAGVQDPVAGSWNKEKWNFYRWMLAVYVLLFRGCCPSFSLATWEDMVNMGIMTEDEKVILMKAVHPRKVLLKWCSVWIQYHIKDDFVRSHILNKLCVARGNSAGLSDQLEQRAPWSFEAILYAAVKIFIILLPAGHTKLLELDDRVTLVESFPFVPTLANCVACFFYSSLLNLLERFKEPFLSDSVDGIDPNTVILESETQFIDVLTCPIPECLKGFAKTDEVYDEQAAAKDHRASLNFRKSLLEESRERKSILQAQRKSHFVLPQGSNGDSGPSGISFPPSSLPSDSTARQRKTPVEGDSDDDA
mmetsp:Transcript_41917/g.90559  ORF Transcript_41917/g.90559 Transcript_41917/m.90559 type:complete len:622 (-) Transcript_41917:25-1890(-)|eukprot:CAMPEP_0206468576 /NCGR_PEP_ID=MMETSP0324_2-20121206/29713_1 /ASSEMBLY_ACC=CAM_ASM_000836 /TAXON_ID=2866 /ORGANISM="Crypthecodinium cohnii, Strain Seligo" /LENGTH=621 /DNA_ID=CAMNT_0053942063 /DNA_START=241 /DNA_END=2106 /DNA_ORIENTATION=-